MSSPFILPRAITPLTAPPGFPPDVAPNQIIYASHINAIRDSVAIWPGDVDGNGKTLKNAAAVGIGVASPLAQLHVYSGIANAIMRIESAAVCYVDFRRGAQQWFIGSNLAGNDFSIYDAVAARSDLVITAAAGNVGIGLAPAEKLDVLGRIRLRLPASGGALSGIWFDGLTVPNAAFFGMKDNSNTVLRLLNAASAIDVLQVDLNSGTIINGGPGGATLDAMTATAGSWYAYAPSNTQLVFRMRGGDGVWRQGAVTLA